MKIRNTWFILGAVIFLSTLLFAVTKLRQVQLVSSTIDSTTIGATTPSSAVLTTLKVNTSVLNNGSALQHLRVSSCTTGSGANGFCGGTITWNVAWADTNYTAVCMIDGSATISVQGTASKTTTQIGYVVYNVNGNTAAASGTLNCIAMHD